MTNIVRSRARLFYARWRFPLNTFFALVAVFSLWRYRQWALVTEALRRAHLAAIPDEAEFTHVVKTEQFVVSYIEVTFKAPPGAVRAWWDASPGARGAYPSTLALVGAKPTTIPPRPVTSIPPTRHKVYELPKNPDNEGAQVGIEVDGTVQIIVFTM